MSKIREEFAVHLLNAEGIAGARKLGEILTETLDKIEAINGKPSREMSLVKTHLQDAGFWAKRALAVNPEMQVDLHTKDTGVSAEDVSTASAGSESKGMQHQQPNVAVGPSLPRKEEKYQDGVLIESTDRLV